MQPRPVSRSRIRTPAVLVCLVLLALIAPAPSHAEHVSISTSIDAQLVERAGSGSWRVRVTWSAICNGVAPGNGLFQGNLYMIDVGTGDRHYLGGVAGPGSTQYNVASFEEPRQVAFELTLSCFDSATVHGSDTVVTASNPVLIPAKNGDLGDGTGGGGGSGGGSGGSGGPDASEPLASGGCGEVIMGTTAADRLIGGAAGEIVFGLGGDDKLEGRKGHDCLIGGPGGDRLYGGDGGDRLTGGAGRDRLYGGKGTNAHDAGPGADYVDAANGRRETVNCGSGKDRARVDRRDRVRGCERVKRVGR